MTERDGVSDVGNDVMSVVLRVLLIQFRVFFFEPVGCKMRE